MMERRGGSDDEKTRNRRRKRREQRSDGRSRSRSRSVSPERRRDRKETKPKSSHSADKSSMNQQISGYENMSPAERLRAKMKLMLEKTAASEATPTDDVIRPDPVEVLELENDEFIPQSFVSKRTDKLTKGDTDTAVPAPITHDDAIFGKNSSTSITFPQEIHHPPKFSEEVIDLTTPINQSEDRSLEWVQKLVALREKYANTLK